MLEVERTLESRRESSGKEMVVHGPGLNELSHKLSTMSHEIENVESNKSRLENALLKLTEEMFQLKNQFVVHSGLLTSTANQYNSKTKRLHDDYLSNVKYFRRRLFSFRL